MKNDTPTNGPDAADIFEQHHDRLFGIAYRMIGTVADAEDLVQDTFLRWQRTDIAGVRDPEAYLTTVVTRLCLDHLGSARVQREEYVGPWLPEPVVEHAGRDPEEVAEMADSLSMALLTLLETLTPVQRAVFLLREVFGYDYDEVAERVGESRAYCRKIAQRARQHVAAQQPRFDVAPEERDRLMQQFEKAVGDGDMEGLLDVLAEDITLYSDGGGAVTAARKPIYGASNVARFLFGIYGKAPDDLSTRPAGVNGEPGMLVFFGERLQSVWSFHLEGGRIGGIYVVLNPEKLPALPRTASASSSHA